MRDRSPLALVGAKKGRGEPRPVSPQPHEDTRSGSRPEPSRDPIYDDVAEILERAAEAVEEAASALRNVAGMLRG